MKSYLTLLIKVFFAWLLLQFVAFNIVSFALWMQGWVRSIVWLWKELWIVIIAGFLLYHSGIIKLLGISSYTNKNLTLPILDRGIKRLTRWTIVCIIRTAVTHIFILAQPINTYVIGLKYDMIGFILVIIWYHLWSALTDTQLDTIIKTYIRWMKYLLLGALVWYAVILIKPWALKLLWYNNFIYEWQAGGQAPAAYYTHINQWIPRNQFLFERPTTWWFFLVMLRPLFFIRYLYHSPLSKTRARRVIYGSNIIITFSRAAWGVRIIQIGIMILLYYPNDRKKYLRKLAIPIFLVMGVIWYVGYQQIFLRGYSNRWHLAMLQQWVAMFVDNPLIGQWLASAWPGSHRQWWNAFNPENQFLQILIEMGVSWWIIRLLCYRWMNWIGIQQYMVSKYTKHLLYLSAISISMIGLTISGMVLHSFADRMVVYPLGLLFGLILWRSRIRTTTM